jgi:hypothetical protein
LLAQDRKEENLTMLKRVERLQNINQTNNRNSNPHHSPVNSIQKKMVQLRGIEMGLQNTKEPKLNFNYLESP